MSGRKTISNSFSVTTVVDGESAPYYFQEWFAWSSVVSTNNVTTSPFGNNTEPNPAWSTSIPENTGGLAYLWRKSIRYVWNENTRDYSAETAQYVRMSGTNGTSINVKGNVDYAYQNVSSLPPASSSPGKKALIKEDNSLYSCVLVYPNYQWVQDPSVSISDGDSYTVGEGNFSGNYQSTSNLTGHLVMWSDEAHDWVDLGKFQGANGVTYYTHVAWATNVDSTTNPITVTDFITTKPASDTTHIWMGVYVDTNSGQDSSNAALYTWSNTKGDKGVDAVYAYASTDKIVVECNSDGTVKTAVNKTITLTMKVGDATFSFFTQINIGTLPSGVSVQRNGSDTVLVSVGTTATSAGIAAGFDMTLHAYNGTDSFQAPIHIALIGSVQGQDASEVNPNILLRTIFDDGIDKVKEAWSSNWTVTSIDAATDTVVQGRKSLRINMANGQTGNCDLFQVIFGKLKASTWYTVSFNYFATQAWNTFLHSNVGSYPAYYDASAGIIIDGVMQTMSGNNGTWQWPADWTGKRHTMTFKTASDLSGIWDNSQLLFRVPQGCQLALCMPKMEEGEVATAYMANEDDLRGQRGKTGRFYYYAGCDWNASDSTQQFAVTDVSVPFFSKAGSSSNKYYVYNPDVMPAGGQMTMAQMAAATTVSGSINWNNKPWEVMTDDFKYLITEAIFASFAKLGSFVISSDWMLSTNGTINGTAYNNGASYNGAAAYTWFDPAYPNTSVNTTHTVNGTTWTGYNFVPNYCVDGRTGTTFQTSGVFSGFIKKKKTVITTDNISEYTKDYSHGSFTWKYILLEKCGTFIEVGNGVNYDVMMPFFSKRITGMTEEEKDEIRSYIGTKVIIYNKTGMILGVFLNNSVTASETKLMNNNTCCCFECVLWSEYVSDGYYEVVKWVVVEDSDGKIV